MSESRSVVSDSLQPHGLYSPWNFPDQNTGVGSLSLLQGIFPTQGSNPRLPHCRRILYQLSHKESLKYVVNWAFSLRISLCIIIWRYLVISHLSSELYSNKWLQYLVDIKLFKILVMVLFFLVTVFLMDTIIIKIVVFSDFSFWVLRKLCVHSKSYLKAQFLLKETCCVCFH